MTDDHGPDCACTECLWMRNGTPEDTIEGIKAVGAIGALILIVALVVSLFIPDADAARLQGTVTVMRADGTPETIGPCYATAGAQIQYGPGQAEVILGLDCVVVFRDGFEE